MPGAAPGQLYGETVQRLASLGSEIGDLAFAPLAVPR